MKNVSTGVFSQLYYHLTDTVRLTGGVRWTWDERSVVLLKSAGLIPVLVDISEFIKLEGCVTCLSIRLREAPGS